MAMKAPRICGCGYRIAHGALCPCERGRDRERRRRADESRPSAAARGYGRRWREESAAFLARPENRSCACGCGRRADMVDHRRAHKGDAALFWDRSNWQPMARACNSAKAAREEGGFGNPQVRPAGA